jgi:hypothetical protein
MSFSDSAEEVDESGKEEWWWQIPSNKNFSIWEERG